MKKALFCWKGLGSNLVPPKNLYPFNYNLTSASSKESKDKEFSDAID